MASHRSELIIREEEFEYEDHGLRFSQVNVSQGLISMEDVDRNKII